MAGRSVEIPAAGAVTDEPQWSPAVMAGRSSFEGYVRSVYQSPQWSPAVMAGRSRRVRDRRGGLTGRNGARP